MRTQELHNLDPVRQHQVEKQRTFVRLPKQIKDEIQTIAKGQGVSLNAIIVHAVIEHIKRQK